MKIRCISGSDFGELIPEVARLRIEVFSEWPYLYNGSMEYEREYLQSLADTAKGCIVVAEDQGRIVGVSTGMPLAEAFEEIRVGYDDPKGIFYYGESVVIKSYRGQGIGSKFFVEREQFVRNLGFFHTICFCSIERVGTAPQDIFDLEPMWKRRGFVKRADRFVNVRYDEIGKGEVDHKLVFWEKCLLSKL